MVSRSLRILQSDSLALPTSLFTWRRRLSSCRLASRRRWCRDQVPCLRKCIRSRSLWAKRFPTETEITSTTLHQCFSIIPQARGITSAFNSIASVFVIDRIDSYLIGCRVQRHQFLFRQLLDHGCGVAIAQHVVRGTDAIPEPARQGKEETREETKREKRETNG